ncbi:MAG: UDP binding domain-containing protein, partial [Rhodospirillales bacterium]
NPGPGVGGHCIAVDPWFIVDGAPEQTRIIRTARKINSQVPGQVVARVLKAAEEKKSFRIACLGLSYKADVDDLRESPAMEIVGALAENDGLSIKVVEPHINELPDELKGFSGVTLAPLDEAVEWADVVVLLVDHQPFKNVDRLQISKKVVIDTRGVWR